MQTCVECYKAALYDIEISHFCLVSANVESGGGVCC